MLVEKLSEEVPDGGGDADPKRWTGGWPQDRAEFDSFVDAFQDRLIWYAYRRLGSLPEAEDVAQDVFVKAYSSRTALRGVTSVTAYMYRMAGNLCADRARRSKLVRVPLTEIPSEQSFDHRADAARYAVAAEELRRANDLLNRLPDDQAEVLRHRVFDGLSLAEIAELEGTSLATIKSRLRYGLGKLRRILTSRKESKS